MAVDGTDFSEWLSNLAREAGYDPEPRRGGRTRLAQAAGLNATHMGRLLDGVTKPEVGSMQKLVGPINEGLKANRVDRKITILDMLLQAGDITEEDLGKASHGDAPVTPDDIDLWSVGQNLGVPEDQRHLFGRLVQSLADQLSHGQKEASVSTHATQTGGKSSAEG